MKIKKEESDMTVPKIFLGEMYFRGTPNMDSYFTNKGLTRLDLNYNYWDNLDKIHYNSDNEKSIIDIANISKKHPNIFRSNDYYSDRYENGYFRANLIKNKLHLEGQMDYYVSSKEEGRIYLEQQISDIKKNSYLYHPIILDITRPIGNDSYISYEDVIYDYSNPQITVLLNEIGALLEMYKNGKINKDNLQYLKEISGLLKEINDSYYEFIKEYKTLKLK